MRRVSMVSSEPPPNSTATSNSSRIAAKFLEVDDIDSPPCGMFYRLRLVVRRILTRPLLPTVQPARRRSTFGTRGRYGVAASPSSDALLLGRVRGVRWLDQL